MGDSGLGGALRESMASLASLRKSQAQVVSEAKVSYYLSSDRSRLGFRTHDQGAPVPAPRTPTPRLRRSSAAERDEASSVASGADSKGGIRVSVGEGPGIEDILRGSHWAETGETGGGPDRASQVAVAAVRCSAIPRRGA